MLPIQGLKYSVYNKLDDRAKSLAHKCRVVPIVDQFYELWLDDDTPRWILAGSYGSGKSFFVADKFIRKCINDDYFRCYYGRKVKDNVRGSIFITIVEEIERMGLEK